MRALYEICAGPLLWVSFLFCFGGLIVRFMSLYRLARAKDGVVFDNFQSGWAAASIGRWLAPLNITARTSPLTTAAGFVFHIGLLACALFASAHAILWEEAFGIAWPSLPDGVSDALAVLFLAAALFYAARRIIRPEVAALTTAGDWLAWAIPVAPMLTGLLCHLQIGDYDIMIALHVASGNLMLLAIPVTKLSHVVFFFASRAVAGSDFGKRGVGAW